ncbi:MAG: TrkH family potassium uptake protein [Rikenellaceae bacterium]|nr:TrkH family potassium uptake protein [Rikenellaceae bacterium]
MRANIVMRYMGYVMLLNAAFMLLSAATSHYFGDTALYPLLLSGVLTAAVGAIPIMFVPGGEKISNKEGYCIVVGSWMMSCLVGMMPYLLWGGEFTLVNAWFESVSGYTTTGASILKNIEAVPKGLLFWRSATHWMGGIGVVMFALVILPSIGKTKMTISSVEISNLAKDNYQYRSNVIMHILLWVYVSMTLVCTVLLKICGMNWFDAVNHAFSAVATGGFSTKNLSVGAFNNGWAELVLAFFMLMSSIHYGVIFATITGKHNNLFRSEVVRYFLGSVVVCGLVCAISTRLGGLYDSFGQALRAGLFQCASLVTTTGFNTTNVFNWGSIAMMALLFMSIQCGCAGSTSGGLKADRVVLAFKVFKMRIKQQQHPNAVIRIKLNGQIQESGVVDYAMQFVVAYALMIAVGAVVFAMCGFSFDGAVSASVASIGNVGMEVCDFGGFPEAPGFVRFFSPVLMLFGRLEIFGFIQLFLLSTWK